MSKDTSLDALINHINELESSDRLTKAKANGWKTACRSLVRSLSPTDQSNVTLIDPEKAAEAYRYAQGNTDKAHNTAKEYRGRLECALESFREADDNGKKSGSSETLTTTTVSEDSSESKTVSHTLSLPLRADFIAQLVIPYDISTKEVAAINDTLKILLNLRND